MVQAQNRSMTAPALQGLLFDKDGTLFDFHRSWAPINLRSVALAAGRDAVLREKLVMVGAIDGTTGHARPDGLMAAASAGEIAAAFVAAGSPFATDELTDALDALFMEASDNLAPATDLAPLFTRLKARGLKLGVASSDSEAGVREAARRFQFLDLLDFVCGYDSGHGLKPTAGMALAFCRATGIMPGGMAMVGDNLHDMEMGRRAGAALCIGVLTGTGTRDTLAPHASMVLHSIDELEAALGL
jgi:phosphoglycolate phosphatase